MSFWSYLMVENYILHSVLCSKDHLKPTKDRCEVRKLSILYYQANWATENDAPNEDSYKVLGERW